MSEFITPPNHVNFKAKKLFADCGKIVDGAVAYMALNGGGPTEQHTHEHNHLFIVVKGEAKILLGDAWNYSDIGIRMGETECRFYQEI